MVNYSLPLRDVNSFIDLNFPFIFLGVIILAMAAILYVRSFPRLSRWQRISYLLVFNLCSADILYGIVLTPHLLSALTGLRTPCPVVDKARAQLFYHPAFVSSGVIAWCTACILHCKGSLDTLDTPTSIALPLGLLFVPWASAHWAVRTRASVALDLDISSGLVSSPKRAGEPMPCPGLDRDAFDSAKSAAFLGWAIPACIGTLLLCMVAITLPKMIFQQSPLVQRMPVCDSRPPPPPESTQETFLPEEEDNEIKETSQDIPVVVVVADATGQTKTTHHHYVQIDPDPDPAAPLHTVEIPSEEELGWVLYYQAATMVSLLYMVKVASEPSSFDENRLVTVRDRGVWALLLCHLRVVFLPWVWRLFHRYPSIGVCCLRSPPLLVARRLKRMRTCTDAATFRRITFRALLFCSTSWKLVYSIWGFNALRRVSR